MPKPKAKAKPPSRIGRPSKLRQVVRTRETRSPDGTPTGTIEVTVHDSIVDDVRMQGYVEPAAKHAGVHKDSVYEWLKIGAAISTALHKGTRTPSSLRAHERDCLAFSDAVDRAKAEFLLRSNLQLELLANGGIPQTTTTVKRKTLAGNVVEETTTTKTEHTLPDAHVLTWRLERTFPHLYARRTIVEGTGEDGAIPVEVRAAALAQAAMHFRPIDTTATEQPPEERGMETAEDRAAQLAERARAATEEER